MTREEQDVAHAPRRSLGAITDRMHNNAKYLPASGFSLLLAAMFYAASLTPSLMPRGAIVQGVLAGGVASVGYGIGQVLVWLWRFLEIPQLPLAWRSFVRNSCYVLALLVLVASTWKAPDWQNSTHAAVGLQPVSTSHPLVIIAVSVSVFSLVWLVALAFLYLLHTARRQLERVVPRRVSALFGFIFTIWVFWASVKVFC